MNIALIFAGGVGSRMNSTSKPKQFLELYGKPVIIHTIEIFENHPEIDAIVVVCVDGWVNYLKNKLNKFQIKKVTDVIIGGNTGQLSIYNGLKCISEKYPNDSIVIVHDGVRPLIDEKIITDNIKQVKVSGSAITTSPTVETFVVIDENFKVLEVPSRQHSKLAKAPQSFILEDLLDAHEKALKDGIENSIDSCTLMNKYGKSLTLVEGPIENIKITTPTDFYIFRAIMDVRENSQIFGN